MTNQMGDTLVVEALGIDVALDLAEDVSPELETEVRRAWQSTLSSSEDADARVTVANRDPAKVLESLSSRVTMAALSHQKGKLLMFHAGGVADPSGRVIAFIGPSGTGKTTLTRILATEYGYVSDETIAVDSDLRVLPYRKPLSIVRDGLPKEQISASEAGLMDLTETPLTLSKLVVLDRVTDGPAEFAHLELAEALPAMFKEMSYLRDFDRPLQQLASIASATGGALRLTYSSAKDILPLIPELLEHYAPAEPWSPSLPPEPAPTSSIALQPAPMLDAIDLGHSVTVFTAEGTVRTLGGLGPDVWRAACTGLTSSETLSALLRRHGSPEGVDPEPQFNLILEELSQAGVITLQSFADL